MLSERVWEEVCSDATPVLLAVSHEFKPGSVAGTAYQLKLLYCIDDHHIETALGAGAAGNSEHYYRITLAPNTGVDSDTQSVDLVNERTSTGRSPAAGTLSA